MSQQTSAQKTALSPLLKNEIGNITVYTSPFSESVKSVKSAHALPKGTSSIGGVYQNMLNCLVGAGILGIPSVYATCGVFGGLILMLIFAILCTVSRYYSCVAMPFHQNNVFYNTHSTQ